MNIHRYQLIGRAVIAAGLVLTAAPFHSALALGAIAGATESTQIANNVELVMQYTRQME